MNFSFTSNPSRFLLLLLAVALAPYAHSEQQGLKSTEMLNGYVSIPFSIPVDIEKIHLVDLNADTRQDLILEFPYELRVVYQDAEGLDLSNYQSIPIPQHFAIWDVASVGSPDDSLAILVLDSDSNLTIWRFLESSYQEEVVTLPVPSIHLPKDTKRSRFCIDINGDSIDDLALPTTHFLFVLELGDNRIIENTSKIPLLSTSSASLSTDELNGNVGQTYRASSAEFRDVDNDSHMDVIVQNDSAVRISLGNASEASYFSSIPDYDINFEKDTRKVNFDSIDFSNLFSLIRFVPNRVQIVDVNQDQLVDLIILEPNRVLTYIAGENGIDTSKPTQVMRFNENTFVLHILDLNADGMSDLVAVKTPYDISVRRALLALVLPTSLRFEFFVFHHTKGMFSRRPDLRLLVNLKVPALLPTIVRTANVQVRQREVEASIRLDLLGSESEPPTPILDAQLDSVEARDVIAIQSGEVRVFFNVIENSYDLVERSELDEIETLLKGGRELTFDVGEMLTAEAETSTHMDLITDTDPVVIHRLDSTPKFHDLMRFRLNYDQLDDIMIFEDRTEEAITGVLLLSRKP